MKTNKQGIREKWMNYFYQESQNCEQKPTHLTPDTHGIILDFITQHHQDLMSEVVEKSEGKRILELCEDKDTDLYEREVGYNQAIDDIIKSLSQSIKR